MKAIILAAGLGSRLRPLTDSIPKCLVPIRGVPLLGIWLDLLSKAGVTEILINLHYRAELVRAYVESTRFIDRITFVYEEKLLGTAGTIKKNSQFFSEESLMVLHADNLSYFDIEQFLLAHIHRPSNTAMTIMSFTTDQAQSCGVFKIDERNITTQFYEKVKNPPSNLANGAIYIIEREVLDFILQQKDLQLDFSTQVIPQYIGRSYLWHNASFHLDIGSLENLLRAQKEYVFQLNAEMSTPYWSDYWSKDDCQNFKKLAEVMLDTGKYSLKKNNKLGNHANIDVQLLGSNFYLTSKQNDAIAGAAVDRISDNPALEIFFVAQSPQTILSDEMIITNSSNVMLMSRTS